MSCNCVKINLTIEKYQIEVFGETYGAQTVELIPRGRLNGANWYLLTLQSLFPVQTDYFTIWYDSTNDRWNVQTGQLPNNGGIIHLNWLTNIPIEVSGIVAVGEWVKLTTKFATFGSFYSVPQTYVNSVNVAGTYAGNNYYQWQIEGVEFYLYCELTQWEIGYTLGGQAISFVKNSAGPCPPLAQTPVWLGNFTYVKTESCDAYEILCLNLCYSIEGETQCIDVNIYDIDENDAPQFVFELPEFPGQQFKILLGDFGAPFFFGWYLVTLGPAGDVVAYLENDGSFVSFPSSGASNTYGWSQNTYFDFTTQTAKSCPVIENVCDCGISFDFVFNGVPFPTITAEASGVYNGRNYFEFDVEFSPGFPDVFYCFFNGVQWDVSDSLGGGPIARLYLNAFCPIGNPAPSEPDSFLNYWLVAGDNNYLKTEGVNCTTCGREDRIFRKYDAITLPVNFEEKNRGLKECCCENLVLASASNNSWENDKTSA
ncbi:hypothetical protein UFOVP611_1, partial [uncultured Caudovirales phage]